MTDKNESEGLGFGEFLMWALISIPLNFITAGGLGIFVLMPVLWVFDLKWIDFKSLYICCYPLTVWFYCSNN